MELFTIAIFYLSISILLLKFPYLIHKPKKIFWPFKNVAVIAHRGGSGEHPENTLDAFKNSQWCDILELDVVFTKDQQIVISHDDSLHRLCNIPAKISDFCFSDLPAYSSSFKTHFIPNLISFNEPGKFCLLEELLQQCPNSMMCIDLKTSTRPAMIELTNLMKKYNRGQNTILGMNSMALNNELHSMNPETLQFMPMGKVLIIYLFYILGLIGILPIKENIIAMPIMTDTFKSLKIEEMGRIRAAIYTLIVIFFYHISGPLFKHLQKRGIKVLYWTLNQESDYKKAVLKNCDGIITDYPKLLSTFLSNTKTI